ncbi:MAG: type IV pilus modification protein PilV [Lysobacterales bacterium]
MNSENRQRGFTLIEVLIALLIFSLGMMGMAALMIVSVKTNQSAFLRTQASFLAQSMADRMRGNMGQILAYNGTYDAASAGSDPCASGAVCTPANLVNRDRALWSQQLITSLPNPTAVVACDGFTLGTIDQLGSAPFNGLCTLTIQWDEATLARGTNSATPGTATPDIQTFAWVFQP